MGVLFLNAYTEKGAPLLLSPRRGPPRYCCGWLVGWWESMAGASVALGTTENLGRIHWSCEKWGVQNSTISVCSDNINQRTRNDWYDPNKRLTLHICSCTLEYKVNEFCERLTYRLIHLENITAWYVSGPYRHVRELVRNLGFRTVWISWNFLESNKLHQISSKKGEIDEKFQHF